MEELLNKINAAIDSSIESSSEETALQLRILKGNIKTIFDEANLSTWTLPVPAPEKEEVDDTPVKEDPSTILHIGEDEPEQTSKLVLDDITIDSLNEIKTPEALEKEPEPVNEPAPEPQPVETEVKEEVAGIPNFENTTETSTVTNGKKILIVDDSSIIRNYLEKLCKDKYSITMAPGGAEAINYLGSDKFDLMLLDLMMPGVDGFGVLDYVKGNNVIIPTIIISGDTTKESIDRAFTYNVVDMIEKPFSEKTIMEKINRILE